MPLDLRTPIKPQKNAPRLDYTNEGKQPVHATIKSSMQKLSHTKPNYSYKVLHEQPQGKTKSKCCDGRNHQIQLLTSTASTQVKTSTTYKSNHNNKSSSIQKLRTQENPKSLITSKVFLLLTNTP